MEIAKNKKASSPSIHPLSQTEKTSNNVPILLLSSSVNEEAIFIFEINVCSGIFSILTTLDTFKIALKDLSCSTVISG